MIISDGLIRYLQLIHSKDQSGEIYRHDDPVIKRYEILREYARSDFSSRKLNELANRYEINAKTIKNYLETKRKSGTLSLFAEPLIAAYNLITADLEKKIVILYRSGETTNKNILKAIRTIDPALKSLGLTSRHINRVLRSHGLIPTQGLENVNFRVLQALLSLSFPKSVGVVVWKTFMIRKIKSSNAWRCFERFTIRRLALIRNPWCPRPIRVASQRLNFSTSKSSL
jgi:hypothetical protein